MTEYTHVCIQCGETFTCHQPKAKYCGHECSSIASRSVKNMTYVCAICGETFIPGRKDQKCCSQKCAKELSIQTLTQKYDTPVDPCPNCGEPVRHVMQKHGHRQIFCNQACAFAYHKKHPTPHMVSEKTRQRIESKMALRIEKREQSLLKTCIVCGKQFKALQLNQLCCSDECKKVRAKDTSRVLAVSRYVPKSFKCKECGETVVTQYGDWRSDGAFCSDACATIWTRRRGHVQRRARLWNVLFEDFTNTEIFERDHWVCAICGQPVDHEPSLFAYNPLAASLDHIVPLARGGSHTRDNVRCVHFICNSLKSDADDIVAKERAKRWFKKQMTGHAVVMRVVGHV